MIFTYHHSREEGWVSIARAVSSSRFGFSGFQPVKAEMAIAVPKNKQKSR